MDSAARTLRSSSRASMFVPRRRLPGGVGSFVAGAWLAALAAFIVMAAFAAEHARFAGDLWVSHHLQRIDSMGFAGSVDVAEALASSPYVAVLIGGPMVLLWYFGHRRDALFMFAVPLGWTLNAVVKRLVDRPRPSALLVSVNGRPGDASFPSGQTAIAMLAFSMIFYFSKLYIRRAWLRTAVQGFCVYGVIFTGLARIYHGLHWASDVYGSILLASLVLAVVIVLHRWVHNASADSARSEPMGSRWSGEEPESRD